MKSDCNECTNGRHEKCEDMMPSFCKCWENFHEPQVGAKLAPYREDKTK